MSFMNSYKRLEKLCSEIYNDHHGVSSYIEEMKNTLTGSRYVSGWDDDLRQLKHYRWVRNQIAHDPGCTEETMCYPEDVEWLDHFYSRIMSGNDPLTLYRKVQKPQTISRPRQTYTQSAHRTTYTPHHSTRKDLEGCLFYAIGALMMGLAGICVVLGFLL